MRSVFGFVVAMIISQQALAAQFLTFPVSGQYVITCQAAEVASGGTLDPNTGTFEIGFERIDASAPGEIFRAPVDVVTGKVTATLNVTVTPGADAEVACFAYDKSGNRSDRSVDSKLMDFTAPGVPVVEP